MEGFCFSTVCEMETEITFGSAKKQTPVLKEIEKKNHFECFKRNKKMGKKCYSHKNI